MFRFLREDHDEPPKDGPDAWDEALARKFYSNLWKEYAICDLKHYKSGNVRLFSFSDIVSLLINSAFVCRQFSLRWRTEDEVVSGAGESSCGNTRCRHHEPTDSMASSSGRYGRESTRSEHRVKGGPILRTLELPFGYVEQGEVKSALVKVVLCEKCVKKIMWKREQVKRSATAQPGGDTGITGDQGASQLAESDETRRLHARDNEKRTKSNPSEEHRRRRRSRSLSPERRSKRK